MANIKLNTDVGKDIVDILRDLTPTLEDFLNTMMHSGDEDKKRFIDSVKDIDAFKNVLDDIKEDMSDSNKSQDSSEIANKIRKELQILFQRNIFDSESEQSRNTIDLLKKIVTSLEGSQGRGDDGDAGFRKEIEAAIKNVVGKNISSPVSLSNTYESDITFDYIKNSNPQIFNEINKVFNIEDGKVNQRGSDAEFVAAINNGFGDALRKENNFLKTAIKKQEKYLKTLSETGASSDDFEQPLKEMHELQENLKAIEKIQHETNEKIKKSYGVNSSESKKISNDVSGNDKDRQKLLDKKASESIGVFEKLSKSGITLNNTLNGLERSTDDLGRLFEGIGGNNKSIGAMQGAFNNLTSVMSNGILTISALSAAIGIATAAVMNFQEDLDVARSFGGGSDMVKGIQNMHVNTLIDPQQLGEMSENLGSDFGISLRSNQKELEKTAIKQRLTERIMGKQYAEQQVEAMGDLKSVLSSSSPVGMINDLQSSTMSLANTMGISNKLALDHIKALAANTKEIGRSLDKGQRAILQDQMEQQLAALKGLGLSDDHAKEVMDRLKDVYTEEGASNAALHTNQLLSMDPDTVNRIAASVGAGSGKQMQEAFQYLNMGHGDATKASVLMAEKFGISQEAALKQINASVFAQEVAGNTLVKQYKDNGQYVKMSMLLDKGYTDGILAEQANQTGALEKMSNNMQKSRDIKSAQQVMPDFEKILIGMGAKDEKSKQEILDSLIKGLGEDTEKRKEFEKLRASGLSDQQAYAKVMTTEIKKAGEDLNAGKAVSMGGRNISKEESSRISKLSDTDLLQELGKINDTAAEKSRDEVTKAATKAMYDLYDAILPLVNKILPYLTAGITLVAENFNWLAGGVLGLITLFAGFKVFKGISGLLGGIGKKIGGLFSSNTIDTDGIAKSTRRIAKEGHKVADTFRSMVSKIKNSISGIGGKDKGIFGRKKDGDGGIFGRKKDDSGGLFGGRGKKGGGLMGDGSSNLGRTMNRLNNTMKSLIKSINRLIRSMGDTGQSFEDFDFERGSKKSKRTKDRTSRRSGRTSKTSTRRSGTSKLSKLKTGTTKKFKSLSSSLKASGKAGLGKIKSIGSSAGSSIKGIIGGAGGLGELGGAAGGLMKGLGKLAGPLAIAFTAVDGITGAIDGWSKASDYFSDDLEKQTELLSTASPEAQKYAESLSKTGKAFWDGTQYVDEFGNTIEAQPAIFQKAASAFGGAVESLSFGFLDGQMVANATAGIFKWFGEVMESTGLNESFSKLGEVIKQVGTKLMDIGKTVITFLQPTFDSIKTVFTGIIESIKGFIDIVVGVFTLDGDTIIGGLKSLLGGIFDIVTSPFKAVLGYIDEVFGTGLTGIFTSIKDSIFNIVGGYIDVVTAPFKSIMAWFSGEISFLDIFTTAWNTAKDGLITMFGGLKDIILMPFKAAAKGIKDLLSFIPGLGGNDEVDALLNTKGTATDSQKAIADNATASLGLEKGMFGYNELDKDTLTEKAQGLSSDEIKALIASDKIDNNNIKQLAEILVGRGETKPTEIAVTSVPAKADGGSTGGLGDAFAKMIMTSGTETPVATVGQDEFVFSKAMISDFLGGVKGTGTGGHGKSIKGGTPEHKKGTKIGDDLNSRVDKSISDLSGNLMNGFHTFGTSIVAGIDKGSMISAKGFDNLSELSENLLDTTEEVNEDGTKVQVIESTAKTTETNELLTGILGALSNLKVMSGYAPDEGLGGVSSDGKPVNFGKSTRSTRATKAEKQAAKEKFEASGNFVQDVAKHIFKAETGNTEGGYSAAKDIGDGAGISFGAYQLTEKSGGIDKYLKAMAGQGDATAIALSQQMQGGMFKGDKSKLTSYLKTSGDTEQGRAAQDKIFSNDYLAPALNIAQKNNVTDKAAIAQIIDHTVNAGVGGANRMVNKAGGDFSAEGIANARKKDYSGLKNFGKYGKGWTNRVNNLSESFKMYEGQSITDDTKPTQKIASVHTQKPAIDAIAQASAVVSKHTASLTNQTGMLAAVHSPQLEKTARNVEPTNLHGLNRKVSQASIGLAPLTNNVPSILPTHGQHKGIDGKKAIASVTSAGLARLAHTTPNILPPKVKGIVDDISRKSGGILNNKKGVDGKRVIDSITSKGLATLSHKAPNILPPKVNGIVGEIARSSGNILKPAKKKGIGEKKTIDSIASVGSRILGEKKLSSMVPNIGSLARSKGTGGFINAAAKAFIPKGIPSKIDNMAGSLAAHIPSAANIPSGFSGAMTNVTNNNNIPGAANANLEKMISELVFVNKQQLGHLGKTAVESALQTRQAQKSHKAQIDRHDNFRQHDITSNRNMILK